jgi:hydroxymethylbilane synthase
MAKLRIGSRGSQLALWQASHVAALLRGRGHEVSIEIIKTTGDKITEVALLKVGTKGMFTKEIEEALTEQRIDLAVHSLKDLPTELSAEFALGAILPREDARDAFVSQEHKSLSSLPKNARVGTSSLRREAQLRAMRPDLQVLSLRGNVDTRLRKLENGEFDAIILAAAGLKRLEREEMVRERLSLDQMCPAAGQGALAIEVRMGEAAVTDAISFMDDAASRTTTTCERALLNGLGGGCQVPIGAHAEFSGDQMLLTAVVASPDGTRVLRERQMDREPLKLGGSVAELLLGKGAQEILDSIYGTAAPMPEQP